MKRWAYAVVLLGVVCIAATSQAQMSVGIGIHFGPRWHRPVYYAPAPVYPVAPVVYPGPVYYPGPVVYPVRPIGVCGPVCRERMEWRAHRRHERWERRQFMRHERWERHEWRGNRDWR